MLRISGQCPRLHLSYSRDVAWPVTGCPLFQTARQVALWSNRRACGDPEGAGREGEEQTPGDGPSALLRSILWL